VPEPIIRVEGLGKRYTLRHQAGGARYRRLSEDLADGVRRPLARLRGTVPPPAATQEEFWALRDVSFDVREGEVLGIIGRNGAGKSTLLKILSRITEPSEGRAILRGRVASLLEVGTGFHPELTGRENIYLNGAILGMTRAEITRKFDEIVAFAEVERFLDTPVKRYSSGMYVRLAFAVAAHLEPEILIVDEVLAVGDAEFQRKCIGKMSLVANSGRTVLFVSHNMTAIRELCTRALVLSDGRLSADTSIASAIACYLSRNEVKSDSYTWTCSNNALGRGGFLLRGVSLKDIDGGMLPFVDASRDFLIEILYELKKPYRNLRLSFRLLDADGNIAFTTAGHWERAPNSSMKSGIYQGRCRIPGNFLNINTYAIAVGADIPFEHVLLEPYVTLRFHVEIAGAGGSRYQEKWPGAVRPALDWTTIEVGRQERTLVAMP
jgi:lipopolysaccharide transport system ATP-binding protein